MKTSLLIVLLGLPIISTVQATTYCVTTGPQLAAALASADSNGQADVIRLAVGTYDAGSGFVFRPGAAENFDITISGGWTSFFGNACGQQLDSTSPFQTAVVATSLGRVLNIEPPANSNMDVTIERIHFAGGEGTGDGGGLRVWPFSGASGDINIERCSFVDNQAARGSGLAISTAGIVRVKNSIFAINHATSYATVLLGAFDNGGIYFINNTVVLNTTSNPITSRGAGLDARVDDGANAFIANNNLWDNQHLDARIAQDVGTGVWFYNNNVEDSAGLSQAIMSANISVTPVYESGLFNFTPAFGSPLLDAGRNSPGAVPFPVPFHFAWGTGSHDFRGFTRRLGSSVDIGAFEAIPTLVFANGFE